MGKRFESDFQGPLIKKLQAQYPNAYVFKNETSSIQGLPDVCILHESGRWATLECKRSEDEPFQPNQEYYVEDMNRKSFSAVIYPENEKEILDALQRSLRPRRNSRSSRG